MTHVWPKDDSFDLDGTALPDFYSSWIACHSFPVAKAFGTGGGGIAAATILTREPKCLTDAYSPASDSRLAAISIGDFSADGGDLAMFLRRDVVSNSSSFRIEAGIQILNVLGASSSNNVPGHFFVCARVSGMDPAGPAAQSWGDEYYLGVGLTPLTGYFFGSASSVGNGSRFYLVKVVAGVVSTIAEALFNPSGGTHLYSDVFGDKTLPHFYRMEFSNDGAGGIDIACIAGTASGETTIFFANDPSPITTAGRAGFMAQAEADASTLKFVTAIPYVRIDVDGASVCIDEWVRRQREDARLAQAAIHTAVAGRDLRSGWTGDALGNDTLFDPWLRDGSLHSLANRTAHFAAAVPLGSNALEPWREGYSLSQRRSTSSTSHHRQIRVRFGSSGTAPTGDERRWAGVALRCDLVGSLAVDEPFGGYLFQVSTDDGGTFANPRLELWRIASDGASALLIAEDEIIPILVGTDYEVALQVFNVPDAGGNPDGLVVLKAYVDGAQVAFALTDDAIAAGLEDGGGGTLIDNTSAAIRDSYGEGFRIGSFTGSRFTYVDEWTELALEGDLGTNESDQATIPVFSEVYNYSGETLTLPSSWIVEETTETFADEFPLETGYVRRGLRYPDERRTWIVYGGVFTDDERDDLLEFWDAHDGLDRAFSWTPPRESIAVKVHFPDDALGSALRAPGVTAFSFGLEQLFEEE